MIALTLLVSFKPCGAGYTVDAQRLPGFREQLKSAAVLPIECPATLDCLWIEQRFVADLSSVAKLRVVTPAEVRQAALEHRVDLQSPESLATLLPTLGVDAVIIVRVPGVEKKHSGTMANVVESTVIATPLSQTSGTATISCVSLTGDRLFEGQASGSVKGSARTEKGLVAKLLRLTLDKVFGDK